MLVMRRKVIISPLHINSYFNNKKTIAISGPNEKKKLNGIISAAGVGPSLFISMVHFIIDGWWNTRFLFNVTGSSWILFSEVGKSSRRKIFHQKSISVVRFYWIIATNLHIFFSAKIAKGNSIFLQNGIKLSHEKLFNFKKYKNTSRARWWMNLILQDIIFFCQYLT